MRQGKIRGCSRRVSGWQEDAGVSRVLPKCLKGKVIGILGKIPKGRTKISVLKIFELISTKKLCGVTLCFSIG